MANTGTSATAPAPTHAPAAPAPTAPTPAEPTTTAASEPTATEAASAPAAEPGAAPAAVVEPTTPAAAPVTEKTTEAPNEAIKAAKPDATPDAAEEPQNALTSKFTPAEWKAVKELRAELPSIFTKAYPSAEPAPSSITLWGVTLSTTPDARASVILVKFLRARNLVVADAAAMLATTLAWREEFQVDEVMQEQFDPAVFGKLGRVYGVDKEGRPVTYNLYGAVKDMGAVFGDVQKFLRWRVQFMEESIKLLDFETHDQMVQIHDYDGVSFFSGRDANQKAAAKEASALFQSHYPEFLSRKFFLNVPTVLTWIYWLFKPLVSAATLAKMTVVGQGPKAIAPELLPIIDAKELPRQYGGEAPGWDEAKA